MRRPLHVSRVVALLTAAVAMVAGHGSAQVPPCTPPPSGMVAWWPGDGNANDIAGSNNGTIVGGVTYTSGRVSQAFSFDGSTGYVNVPDAPTLDLTSAITIDAWINPVSLGGRIVDKITAGGGNGYLLDTYGGRVRLIIDGQVLSGASALPTGSWSHVAGVYDGTGMRVYVNGALDGTFAYSGGIPTNALSLRIGGDSTGGSLFSGMIDEVEVINRALSQPEIQAIVDAGPGGKCKQAIAAPVPTVSAMGLLVFIMLVAGISLFVLKSRTG